MNISVHNFHLSLLNRVIKGVLNQLKPNFVQIVEYGLDEPLVLSIPCEIERFDVLPITWGEYPVQWGDLPPVENELLEYLSLWEGQTFKMMDKMEAKHMHEVFETGRYYSYDLRVRLYHRHIRFWAWSLRQRQIDVLISAFPPSGIYDFIMVNICKFYNIPVLFLQTTPIPDVIAVGQSYAETSQCLRETYEKLLLQYADTPIEEIELNPLMQSHFDFQTSPKPVPYYMDYFKTSSSWDLCKAAIMDVWNVAKNVPQQFKYVTFRDFLFRFILDRIAAIEARSAMFSFYRFHAIIPDLKTRYVYIALQMQPESTTMPRAGDFVHQLRVVQMISAAFPPDVNIFVKEHPCQGGVSRSIEFYMDIINTTRARLVQREVDSFELMRNAIAVVTCTGTVAYECLFYGKPSIVFGETVTAVYPGVYPVQTIADCKGAAAEILHQPQVPDLKQLRIMTKAYEETDCFTPGFIEEKLAKHFNVSLEEAEKNMTQLFLRAVSRVS